MLNSQQKRAVETTQGKVLVLAGAGSGKTKVIVHRIAHLIQVKGVDPKSILGVTFTNKAAAEMRKRLSQLIDSHLAKKVHLSTFHSFCMQLLRKEIQHLGYTQNFSLYDQRDIHRLVKQLLREELQDRASLESLEPILTRITTARGQNQLPEDRLSRTLYERLKKTLQACNAVDFDSLLSLTLELFEKHPQVLDKYQENFHYIMIDEYQDTNPVQYQIAKTLSAKHSNLCVVGDDDQSIYGWRGAEIKNILSFEADHLIKLEENYRSLPTILNAANSVISHNSERHNKVLFSRDPETEQIVLFHAPTEMDEATAVTSRLLHLRQTRNLRWKDFAILYRSNAISRPFELALMQGIWRKEGNLQRGIPYQVFGGTELFERSEIKDLMSYLRVIVNPKDEEALLRIINVPRRGISEKTLFILTSENRKKNLPLFTLFQKLKHHPELQDRAIKAIQSFVYLIQDLRDRFERDCYRKAFEYLIDTIQYKKAIEEEVKSERMRTFKWENVQSCIVALDQYEQETEKPLLQDFLSNTLLGKNSFAKKKQLFGGDYVNVMTFHSAKGLEFEATFLVALEDHILPHEKTTQLEEERRLMYVAITRAKKHLTLSMAQKRKRYGKETASNPSRFLFEIPKNLLRIVSWRHPY